MTEGSPYPIYAVFDADGYECSDLVAAFSTREKADAFAVKLRDIAAQEWKLMKHEYEDARRIHVIPIVLDAEPNEQHLYSKLRCLEEFKDET